MDLLDIPNNFIPRSIFNLFSENKKQEIVSTPEVKDLVGDFRFAWRNWVSVSNERTLITTIIPPLALHVNTTFSMKFSNHEDLLFFGGLSFSIIFDFFIRVAGIDHIWNDNILNLPFPKSGNKKLKIEIIDRALRLVCVTEDYTVLWDSIKKGKLIWDREQIYLSHKDRRNSLVELDVLSAMILGTTIKDLLLLYKTQFPTLLSNEKETFYDKNGRIVFTTNKGYPGVGFPRKKNKSEKIGWEDIKDMKSGTVERIVIDDTLPEGHVERTIKYEAPFDRCDREKDYEIVWKEFEERFRDKENA